MDELKMFFNAPSSSATQIKLRGPLTGGFRMTREDTSNVLSRREEHRRSILPSGTDYAREVKDREMQKYVKKQSEIKSARGTGNDLESLERPSIPNFSVMNSKEMDEEAMMKVYSKYSFQTKEDTRNLAINDYKQQILDEIRNYPIVIIEGPTGCGKTTQVPQWILDNSYENQKSCDIIVTQPRKIAAISIARRVAQERGWDVGGLVGYQIGLDNNTSSDTRIQYVTTGVLLQKLVATKSLVGYTHIILDEVHERGQEMDFLLLVVKTLLFTVSPSVKVILMSATFNIANFANYFEFPTIVGPQQASCINITNKEPMFAVKIFYLNHLHKFSPAFITQSAESQDPKIEPEMHHLVIKLINAFEEIDQREENYTDRSKVNLPSVLVFLPGINEIEELYACLTDTALRAKVVDEECAKYKWWVLPLHSTITADEQARVFQNAPIGERKIILSTNIAESSITVPDIKYIVDYCLIKQLVVDNITNFTSLQLSWASKTNCEQRAGRAGRVRDGRVYRLVAEKFYESFRQECSPEILRCPLERLVLLAKTLDMGPPSDVLALAMDPPDMSNIQRTILVLKEIGALKNTLEGEWSSSDGDITYLGEIMAKLPLDIRLSKLIVLGYIYGCLDETVIMAAAMSVKNVFSSPFRERLNAYNSKLTWADGSTSDCIAFLNVYKVWNHFRQQQYFKQPGNNEAQWARRFYMQVKALRELDDMVRELRLRLSRNKIDSTKQRSPWARHEIPLVLKVIIAGAFYPQYFVQGSSDEARERDAVRSLAGLNPRNTVYLKDFPSNQPGEVYASAIRNIIRKQIGDEPRVTFDNNSRKVYLTFEETQGIKRNDANKDPTIPGQVVLPVYKSVKARTLRMDIRIPLLPVEKANDIKKAMDTQKLAADMDLVVPRLPDIDETHFPLTISYIVSVSSFWVQYDDESTASDLQLIMKALSSGNLLAYTGECRVGAIYAVPFAYERGSTMRRARVIRMLPKDMLEVDYIDYGGTGRAHMQTVRELPPGVCDSMPPLAMRCTLAEVRPAPLLDAHNQWSSHAFRCFEKLASRRPLLGKVYSVVHGTVVIELLADGGRFNINEELVKQNFAIRCEESYESKLNHDLRQTANELNMAQKRAYNKEQIEQAYNQLWDVEPPSNTECISAVCLKGPYSPLETTLHSLMYASREKTVNIELNSVNSVLLDTDPQELYERLLVAAEVGQSETSSRLTLRHTTLMPNIPALPAIIALIFCPVAELRRDEACERYVSVLCGLGSTEDGLPYFPEHDLLVSIDADLSVNDIGQINHIRYLTDFMLHSIKDETVSSEEVQNIPKTIRHELLGLLMKRRKHREPQAVDSAWEWKSYPEEDQLEIIDPEMVQRAIVYPLHVPMELHPPSREHMLKLKRDNDQLKLLVSRTPISSNVELTCKLCGTAPMPTHAMRIHLYSSAHRDREDDFRTIES